MNHDQHEKLQRWADRGRPRGAVILLEQVEARLAYSDYPSVELRPVQTRRGWAIAAVAAVLVAVTIGLVALIDPFGAEPIPMATEEAVCSTGQNANNPGSADQPRPPHAVSFGPLAVFDSQSGRIVMMAEGQTWSFDVCSNAWEQMQPAPADYVSTVVYDADSDLIVAFVFDAGSPVEVWAYDLESNTWSKKQNPPDEIRARSALYDPVTGLVVTDRSSSDLVTYDVDRDHWETIPIDLGFQIVADGKSPSDSGGVLLAYHPSLDKIVSWGDPMAIIDLRSGEVTIDSDPRPGLVYGFPPPPLIYAQDSESGLGIIHDLGGGSLHAYDPTRPGWDVIYGAGDFDTGPGAPGVRGFDAMVYDSLNGRLVVIGGIVKVSDEWADIDDVWAIDIETGEWTELIPASQSLNNQ